MELDEEEETLIQEDTQSLEEESSDSGNQLSQDVNELKKAIEGLERFFLFSRYVKTDVKKDGIHERVVRIGKAKCMQQSCGKHQYSFSTISKHGLKKHYENVHKAMLGDLIATIEGLSKRGRPAHSRSRDSNLPSKRRRPNHEEDFTRKKNKECSSKVKIYTKTGDKGTSALYTGERRCKSDHIFECLGNVDELSSFIGLAKENALEHKHNYVEQLERIQCILQDVGTLIASPVHSDSAKKARKEKVEERISFSKRHIAELESWIDQFTESLPPLTNFILPGGGKVSASLHVCRTICRRAERSVVRLSTNDIIDQNVIIYLNRLSDYLFTVSRQATIIDGKKETIYIRPKPSKKSDDDDVLTEKG